MSARVLIGLLFLAAAFWRKEDIVTAIGGWKSSKGAARYLPMLRAVEIKYRIPPDLLARLAYQESRFREDIISGRVRSPAGAIGLMQIVPRWHPALDPGDAAADERAALDPPRAADYAGKYLRQLYNQFGSWKLAAAAYNAGPGNVSKYQGIPPFKETQNYVAQIFGDLVDPSQPSTRTLYA